MGIDRKAFHKLTYGLYLVAAESKTEKSACIINTALQVTSKPFQLLIAVNKENFTNHVIADAQKFSVMALNQETDMNFIGNFGFRTMEDFDKFEAYPPEVTDDGFLLWKDNVTATFTCSIVDSMDAGTHMVYLAEVLSSEILNNEVDPLTYPYYHKVLKGTTPPKASSYTGAEDPVDEEEQEAAKPAPLNKFKCLMCGYVYETEDEELPEGFTCPMCGAPKSQFEKIASEPERKGASSMAKINKFKCTVCGYVAETELDELPDDYTCPVCGAPKEKFVKLED